MSEYLAFKGDRICYQGDDLISNITCNKTYHVIACVYRSQYGGLVSVVKNDLGEISYILLNQDWKVMRNKECQI